MTYTTMGTPLSQAHPVHPIILGSPVSPFVSLCPCSAPPHIPIFNKLHTENTITARDAKVQKIDVNINIGDHFKVSEEMERPAVIPMRET